MSSTLPRIFSRFKTSRETHSKEEVRRARWLTSLVVVAAWGLVIILLYAFEKQHRTEILAAVGLGFLSAGAAWLTGALMGFLFGIPHAKDVVIAPDRLTPKKDAPSTEADAERIEVEARRYKPSTSLEQISDWLTKIIVGVGLTQLNKIPGKVDALAGYIAQGIGNEPANRPFAVAIIIYFSVGGFLFGFLWSRLYMIRAFEEAEALRQLQEIKSQLDFNTEAMTLATRQLAEDTPEVSSAVLEQAIREASRTTREAILEKAKEARNAAGASTDIKFRAASVFKALIAADVDNYDHESHGLLGSILREQGEPEASVREFTQAIQIRDRRGKKGWSYYEFRRGLTRIRLEGDSPTRPEDKEQILADLKKAFKDPKRREDFERRKEEIEHWLKKQGLDYTQLQ